MYVNQYLIYDQFALERNLAQTIIADTTEYAEDTFVDAKERLLDVRNWKRYCAQPGVSFLLKDSHGREVNRRAHKGDHINILIPGAESHCCMIETLEYDDYPDLGMETFTMRITPCLHEAGSELDDERLAEAALIIERRNKHVFAAFYTRNAVINNDGAGTNLFGLSDSAWNSLLMRFVD